MCFVLVRRRKLLALETNAFPALETNTLKTRVRTPATHTASYHRLPNKTYVETIASHNYSPPNTGAIALQRSRSRKFYTSLRIIMLAYCYSLSPVQIVLLFSYSPRCSSVSFPSWGLGCSSFFSTFRPGLSPRLKVTSASKKFRAG